MLLKSPQNVLFQWTSQWDTLGSDQFNPLAGTEFESSNEAFDSLINWRHLKVKNYHNSYGIDNFFLCFLFLLKNVHHAGIMPNARTIALCPNLCLQNVSNPTRKLLTTAFSQNPVWKLTQTLY